jgi:hypothetical protein
MDTIRFSRALGNNKHVGRNWQLRQFHDFEKNLFHFCGRVEYSIHHHRQPATLTTMHSPAINISLLSLSVSQAADTIVVAVKLYH